MCGSCLFFCAVSAERRRRDGGTTFKASRPFSATTIVALHGAISAGISTGQDIVLRAAVKPIASIAREQLTVDRSGRETYVRVGGRHDVCAIPRIVPVLAAMVRLVLADAVLLQRRMKGGQ